MAKNIIVYTQDNCKYCSIVKNYLNDREVPFEIRNIDDPEKGEQYREEHSKFGYQAAPVTSIDGYPVVGFDLKKFNELL